MSIFKKLFSLPKPYQTTFHKFNVKCKRCGEIIQGQINVFNDPSLDDSGGSTYTCRKVLIGDGHCFQQIEVIFKFDEDRNVLERQIVGGEFVDAD